MNRNNGSSVSRSDINKAQDRLYRAAVSGKIIAPGEFLFHYFRLGQRLTQASWVLNEYLYFSDFLFEGGKLAVSSKFNSKSAQIAPHALSLRTRLCLQKGVMNIRRNLDGMRRDWRSPLEMLQAWTVSRSALIRAFQTPQPAVKLLDCLPAVENVIEKYISFNLITDVALDLDRGDIVLDFIKAVHDMDEYKPRYNGRGPRKKSIHDKPVAIPGLAAQPA